MPLIKVRDGTRNEDKNLCTTCAHSLVMRGAAESAEVVYCAWGALRKLSTVIIDCNRYYRMGQPSLQDLYRTAWILETSNTAKRFGFVPYKTWRRGHEEEDPNSPLGPPPY